MLTVTLMFALHQTVLFRARGLLSSSSDVFSLRHHTYQYSNIVLLFCSPLLLRNRLSCGYIGWLSGFNRTTPRYVQFIVPKLPLGLVRQGYLINATTGPRLTCCPFFTNILLQMKEIVNYKALYNQPRRYLPAVLCVDYARFTTPSPCQHFCP